MSTLTSDPKFDRGKTLGINVAYYDSVNQPQDLQVGDGLTVVGTHSVFRDENPATGALYSNLTVECVAVKHVVETPSADPTDDYLQCGDKVQLDPTYLDGGRALGATGGAVATLYGIVDEYLTAPVKPGEVCWVVVRGPTAGAAVASGDVDIGKDFNTFDNDNAALVLKRQIVVGSEAHGM